MLLIYFLTWHVLNLYNRIYCYAQKECGTEDGKCSAFGKLNTELGICQCPNNIWGSHCQYGRFKFTSKRGYLLESEGKYHCMSKYMYLIDTESRNTTTPIQLNLAQFSTECNWDYLYIFDGTSIYDPLLASLSGIITQKDAINDTIKTITPKSGAAYFYFFSDLNVNDAGYNISYRISACNSSYCNNHGFCNEKGKCICDEGWAGSHCSNRLCCQTVFDVLSSSQEHTCTQCVGNAEVPARASHAAVACNKQLWIYGGYSFTQTENLRLYSYDFEEQTWKDRGESPFQDRYGHSMVCYGKKLIIFGGKSRNGVVLDETLTFDTNNNLWQVHKKAPLALYGHAAAVVGNTMFVFFGFNEEKIFSEVTMKLELDLEELWRTVNTSGLSVRGRFGHSASYDYLTNAVYIYGGYTLGRLADDLLIFKTGFNKWTYGKPASSSRMLHSASIIGRNLVIFGGNTYNGTTSVEKCHSDRISVYNLDCQDWIPVDTKDLLDSKNRYGHTGVVYNKSLYVFGGFDGTMKNDLFQILLQDDPSKYSDEASCLSAPQVASLVWDTRTNRCRQDEAFIPNPKRRNCKEKTDKCSHFDKCTTCMMASCIWSSNKKCKKTENSPEVKITKPAECPDYNQYLCSLKSNCVSCNQEKNCFWSSIHKTCSYSTNPVILRKACFGKINVTSCEEYGTCSECLTDDEGSCMWCESQKKCINSNAYTVNYLYGQCLEWTSGGNKSCQNVQCSQQRTCRKCFQHPGCGWCSDGSHTGLGKCFDGRQSGPVGNDTCDAKRWHFTECPACYCNGHSACFNGTDICMKCHGNVEGKHCDRCLQGYYGNPENNGTCQRCFCNGHYRSCNQMTGACRCNLKGATGTHCERCDTSKKYFGDAGNGGLCYFQMAVGYQYSSNSTGVTIAAFAAKPRSRSQSLKFNIAHASGAFGYMNLSLHYKNGYYKVITNEYLIGVYRITIEKDDYELDEEVELRFVVYGWKPNEHFAFKATLTHPPKRFDLVYFLIMFLVCFCGLLVLLIVLWKVKQRYDICIRNRRRQYELKERISRPFKSVNVVLTGETPSKSKVAPSLIACEHFATGTVSVGTFLIEYPRDEYGLTPEGSSGIAVGSTLILNSTVKSLSQLQKYSNNTWHKRKGKDVSV